jgi:hypothetical protein
MEKLDFEKKKIAAIQQLKRRGYSVSNTADGGLLVEKGGFWGDYGYDTGIGKDTSHHHIGRTIILTLMYGVGIIGALYFMWRKGQQQKEILSFTS